MNQICSYLNYWSELFYEHLLPQILVLGNKYKNLDTAYYMPSFFKKCKMNSHILVWSCWPLCWVQMFCNNNLVVASFLSSFVYDYGRKCKAEQQKLQTISCGGLLWSTCGQNQPCKASFEMSMLYGWWVYLDQLRWLQSFFVVLTKSSWMLTAQVSHIHVT